MAHQHQGPVVGDLVAAALQLRQGQQQAAGDAALWSVELFCRAQVYEGEPLAMLGHPAGIYFRQAGVAAAHRPPNLLARLLQGLARAQVAVQRLGDSVRMGQLHRLHVAHEVALIRRAAQADIESPLLRHGADTAAGVVVAWIEQAAFGQGEELLGDRAVEGMGVALLEVATAATAN